jgi:glycosyltransferase involved in cell wall biosynthesis
LKISIITVCYNAASTIEDALISVANQENVNVEHILIDGASTDGTVEIIKKYKSVATFVSEPDKGIYDAMNKGIALATGDIVGILNADDFYMNENVLEDVSRIFSDDSVEACYGDLVYIDQLNKDKVIRYWKSKPYVSGLFKSGWVPAHPTFFVRKSVYEKFSLFDLNYKLAADFEILFRLIEQNKIKTKYLPKVLVKMRLGGATNKSYRNIYNQNKEIITILRNHYPKLSFVGFILRKLFSRFSQFFIRPGI